MTATAYDPIGDVQTLTDAVHLYLNPQDRPEDMTVAEARQRVIVAADVCLDRHGLGIRDVLTDAQLAAVCRTTNGSAFYRRWDRKSSEWWRGRREGR